MSRPSAPHPSGGNGRAQRPGVRARRHPPNRLHGWVFRQHQVWVDKHGNEHEIESMPTAYLENVIHFCQRRAEPIKLLTTVDIYLEGLEACVAEEWSEESRAWFLEALSVCLLDAHDVLERTPLMRTLRARLEERGASEEGAP